MNTILLLLLMSNPINYDEVGNEFGVWPKQPEIKLPVQKEPEVMLVRTTSVDMIGVFFGADIKEPGDMIPKNRVITGDVIMEATEDEQGKYVIIYEAICRPVENNIYNFEMEVVPHPDRRTVIQYLDKKKLIWQE